MLTETQLLNHIYQTAQMGVEGIDTVLRYAKNPRLIDALAGSPPRGSVRWPACPPRP